MNLTTPFKQPKMFVIPLEEVMNMKGGVYPNGKNWKVYFKGNFFCRDEHGKIIFSERQGYGFLEYLNQLERDKAFDPSRFKKHGPLRFDEAFQTYLNAKPNDSGWHIAKERTWKKYFKPFFQNMDIREIRKIHIQNLLNELKVSPKTQKNIITVLHGFLNFHREELAVFPSFPQTHYQIPRPRWLNEQEINYIFEFINTKDQPIFNFMRYYGVRPSEACGLLRKNVSWENSTIIIETVWTEGKLKQRTKSGRARELPIIPEMAEYLKVTGDTVFQFHVQGQPYNKKKLEYRWDRACRMANDKYGTRTINLYNLRHSWASQRRRDGYSLELIAEVLGHTDTRTTRQHYADIGAGELVNIMRGKS